MECRRCGKRGHIARACPQTSSKPSSTHKRQQPPQQRPSKTHALEEEDTALNSTSATPASAKAMIVQPTINGTPMKMELDTGSALTIIPDQLYQRHLSEQPLAPTSVILRTYSGEHVKPLGAIHVEVEYNGQHHEGKAVVVKTDGPALFGRDWLQHNHQDRLEPCASPRQQHRVNTAPPRRVVEAPLCRVRRRSWTLPSLQGTSTSRRRSQASVF